MSKTTWAAAILCIGALSACGSKDDPAESEKECIPGRSVACVGDGSCDGHQVCDDDGQGYGACECDSDDTPGSGGMATGSGGSSATGGNDMGGSPNEECAPSTSDYEAPVYVPARPASGACTEKQVEDYFAAECYLSSCEEFSEGGEAADCGACLEPSERGDESYGPLLTLQVGLVTSVETNAAGCVELAGQLDCAKKLQAAQNCARDVCLENCSPSTSEEYDEYSDCQDDAKAGVCADYQAETQCLNADSVALCGGANVFVALGKAACASGG